MAFALTAGTESPSDKTVPKQKGVSFVNVRTFVVSKYGDKAWQQVMDHLSAPDREVIHASVAVGWYEVGLFARLLRSVDSVCGNGDLGLMREVGAWEVSQDFNRVMKIFLRVLSPAQAFKAEARLWRHFQDSGTWKTTRASGGMDSELLDWEVDEALCVELSGYLERLIEYTGGKNVTVKHPACRARGGSTCLFTIRWT